jgi:hypothetical protein
MNPPLPTFAPDADTGAMIAALRTEGAVIVRGLAPPELCDTVRGEGGLRRHHIVRRGRIH